MRVSVSSVMLAICLIATQLSVVAALGFTSGYEYWYSMEGTTHIQDEATINIAAKVGVIPINSSDIDGKLCQLMVEDYYIKITQVSESDHDRKRPQDFTKCVLFDLNEDGEVLSVYYERSEPPSILAAKKAILNLMSSKLVFSQSQIKKGQRWAYATNETGHEGLHSAVYQAEPSDTSVNFHKIKTSKAIKNAKHVHTKKVSVHIDSNIPHEFNTEDEFATTQDSHQQDADLDPAFTTTMPSVRSRGTSTLKLEQVKSSGNRVAPKLKTELLETTLEADLEETTYYSLTDAESIIRSNISCVQKHKGSKRAMPCFRVIMTVIQRMSFEDLQTLVLSYKGRKGWNVVVDALGSAKTVDSLYLLTTEVFTSNASTPTDIMHALTHLVHLNDCPPKMLLNALFHRAFEESWSFQDDHATSQVNDRTKLVVGAMVSAVMKCNQTWADMVIRELETLLGVHDPWHHRQMRSTLTENEMQVHLAEKSVHIYALGNAGKMSSYNHLVSYLNTTETHMQLRFSAVAAVASYEHPEAAELLLQVALNDEEDNVRRNAKLAYKKHPHGGGDLDQFIEQKLYRFSNITTVEHKRMRRGLKETMSRIWQGWEFQLGTPSKDWQKIIGSTNVGASFGLIIDNKADIKIAPLSGYMKANVHDAAWATAHLGIVDYELDIFRAEVCFKGKVEYNINILAEFGFEDVAAAATMFSDAIPNVVANTKSAINSFKECWALLRDGDFWSELIDTVKALPVNVKDLQKVARKILKSLEAYGGLPPVYSMIKDLIQRGSTLFSDIKRDVMTLYNAIVDTISTTLPWAFDEATTAVNDMREAFTNILKNPKTSLQNIGKGVARISTVVAVVLDAKDKLVEANIFDKDNRPYWFDFQKVVGEVFDDVKEIIQALKDAADWLDGNTDEEDEVARTYTGIDLKTMKRNALSEIQQILVTEFLDGPMKDIEKLLEPFLESYNLFKQTVQSIKSAWLLLLDGYQTVRTTIDLIFGTKMNKAFPKKYLESKTCGEGFWESTGKTNYKHVGVDVEAEIGSDIVAPFNGKIVDTSEPGRPQVTLDVEDIKDTQVIMDNVELLPDLNRKEVGAGDIIGTVTKPRWCLDGHVHFSMRKTNVSGDYINPSKYMEKREMVAPTWSQECNHYLLRLKGKTISSGSVTKEPETTDETPQLPNAPDSSALDIEELSEISEGRKKRSTFNDIVDNMKDFMKGFGLPGFDNLKEIFSLNMNKVPLKKILENAKAIGLSSLQDAVTKQLAKVEKFMNEEKCTHPNSLDENELRAALTLRGKPTSGSRQTLIESYLKSETECFGIKSHVSDNIYCSYQPDCLGLSCCVDLKFFIYRMTISVYVRYDPCLLSVIIGVGKWSKMIKISADTTVDHAESIDADSKTTLNMAQLLAVYKVKVEGSFIKVSLAVRWCSTKLVECQDVLHLFQDALLCIPSNDKDSQSTGGKGDEASQSAGGNDPPALSSPMDGTISDVIKYVENSGFDEDTITNLTEQLREAFQGWLMKQIEDAIAQIFGDEFNRPDMCLKAIEINFGPYEEEFFKSKPIPIVAGPVLLKFQMGVSGFYGADFSAEICVLSMKAKASIRPMVGSMAWGSLSGKIWIFDVGLKLIGYLLTTSFPTKAEIEFSRFPLDVKARMDLELTPLRIELHVFVKVTLPLVGSKTLFEGLVWMYQSETIRKNIFNINDAEPDESPPDFSWYSKAKCKKCDDKSDKESSRRKRALGGTPRCVVYQVPGRDYTDPAYVIELAVEDDKSPVNMTYCVGTFIRGCDVVKDKELSGTTTITEKIHTGVKLYFQITAKNNAGMAAYSNCEIPTYDMTLPTGRVQPDFKMSSHPDILKASVLMTDDSTITETKISVGYGTGRNGFQVVPWEEFTQQPDDHRSHSGNDRLSEFHVPKSGQLPWKPFYTENHDEPEECAQVCLTYSGSKCQAFNYDYDADGRCELLDTIEGEIELQKNPHCYYYERQGIGQVGDFEFSNLQLQHDKLLFFNVFARNNLDYVNILSSEGVLIDLTTPSPCHTLNATIDELSAEDCTAFTPNYLHQRCHTQTPIPNYRFITDGEGSMCLFNGHEPLVELKYTRANKMVAANWDGFHDNETGILIYTWSVGQEPCGSEIHPHNDPHAHLFYESEWTHVGVAYPLNLKDGVYYVTVRALNKVEFGGPLSLTLCHSKHFVIDNTPPDFHEIGEAAYDEVTEILTITANASDELSLIKQAEFGLGRSPRDTYILEWQDIEEQSDISYKYTLPDGIPVWAKLRFTNNVLLKSIRHAPRAIFVDLTAPIAGTIYHGVHLGFHRLYQWESDTLCVVWEDFHDPDSGISEYVIAAGTSVSSEDVHPFILLSHSAASYCFTDLSLQHNASYYVTLTAFNGATIPKNISASSQGVLVDLTPPVSGSVKDSLPEEPNTVYSSDPAIVKASWNGFSDPESGLTETHAYINRRLQGSAERNTIHTESLDPTTEFELELHHMHFYHGDEVYVSVSVTNGAGSTSEAESDGFTVDLTDPVMYALVDGGDINVDMKYTTSLTELAATWHFEDSESGIVHFRFTAYSKVGGRASVVYPSDGTHKELPSDATTWKTDEPLNLIPGGFYYARIAAVNGAGLTAIHDTDGVIVDTSRPTILYVHAGVLSGETEEVVDGYVWQNNQQRIQASWRAVDPESGIREYKVFVGTSEGAQDILSETSVGTSLDSLLGNLNLQLTDLELNIPVYYISVVAINGAGVSSEIQSSSPIKVVKTDQNGVVWDGAGLTVEEDEDYASGHYSVTLHFSGFDSPLNGISHYLWGLGTRPRSDDVKVFSSYGIVTEDDHARGLGSMGKAKEILHLDQGVTYFATVRAITGDGSALDSSSDGFTIDSSFPEVSLSILGPTSEEDNTDVPVVYRKSTAVDIQPAFLDSESGISSAWLSVGSYKGGADIADKTEIKDSSVLLLEARDDGRPTYFTISAENHVGLTSSGSAPVVVVDQTAPEEGQLICPFVISSSDITCSWSGTFDRESGIDKYMFAIGSAEGLDDIIGFIDIDRFDVSVTVQTDVPLMETSVAVYFATLAVVNDVGKVAFTYSNAMKVDDTAPIPGWIIELQDFVEVDIATETAYTDFKNINKEFDILCQRDITKVEIAWQEFTDEESGIDYYDVALGSTPGGTQVHDFVKIGGQSSRHTFYPVDLAAVRQVFASVRGFNGVGLFSVAVSNGVYISKHSAGLPPLNPLAVLDGNDLHDKDYQYDNDRLYAHWDLRGDPCPVVAMNWTVHKFDGTIAAPTQMLPIGTVDAEEDEVPMNDGDAFFVELRVTNALGYSYSIHSDGVTIQLEPLIPGDVKDGPMVGVDLNFQPSTDSLSANWGGFGSDKDPETFSDHNNDGVSVEIGSHQSVSHYEVAAGTDRRYPRTRNNIHPFINVGLNTTWKFEHLDLIPRKSYYYITVRAYSMSQTMVEVTSNGIRAGYGGHIVALGEIHMNNYTTTSEEVSFYWSAFEFLVPTLRYYIGIVAGIADTEDMLDCSNMITTDGSMVTISENFTSLFNVYPLTDVGIGTYMQLDNLSLDQGYSYTAFVVALDEAGTCAMIDKRFVVDTTPPIEGKLGVGPDLNLTVLYVPSTEELTVWWEGYTDDESGLMDYGITLMLGSNCDNFNTSLMTTVVEHQLLSPASMNFTYLDLTLQIGQPYYIVLEATNNAGLSTRTVSRPIIVDIVGPIAGTVVDGSDFQHDLLYHGSTTNIDGQILYLADSTTEACPYRRYDMITSDDDWKHIVHKGMWNLPSSRINNVLFLDKQISYGSDGLTVTMENDITTERVLSGALYTNADIDVVASYEFDIKAAGSLQGVTTVAIVDWDQGIMSGYDGNITGGNEPVEKPTVDTDYPGYTIIVDALSGDTCEEEYARTSPMEKNSFGFHIVQDKDAVYHVLMWQVAVNTSRTLDFLLDFDPTNDFHTYSLLVNDGENSNRKDDWNIKLLVDGRYMGDMAGIASLGESATVVIGLYNNHGLITPTENVFDAPKTAAKFRNLRFSPSRTELCRYGNPFIGGDHPIVEFYSGIGSAKGLDDVVQFQKVAEPCIPCLTPCDNKICDPTCDASIVQLIDIGLAGLHLEPADKVQQDNFTFPTAYYLSVKGITGSGMVALSSSNGFYIDVTPPIIDEIHHIDSDWNDYEPSKYQGSNSTIGVYWKATEHESEIQQFLWAIGTTPFATDIQDFVDVGKNYSGMNTNLEGILVNNKTYYVTLQALNGAGLRSTKSSQGITTLFEAPDVSNTPTSIPGATPIGAPESKTVETSSQDSVELSWDQPSPSQVERVYCSIGTAEDKNDILPETLCGVNGSGSLSVNSQGVSINHEENTNLSSVRQLRSRRSVDTVLFEPGRLIFSTISACNEAHKCGNIPMDALLIRRLNDTVLLTDSEGRISGHIVPDVTGGVDYIEISTRFMQSTGQNLIFGILSNSDTHTEYRADTTDIYKSYIVDPSTTLQYSQYTSREINKRIITYLDSGFYLTGLPGSPINGPIEITVKYPSDFVNRSVESFRPILLAWCEVEEIWVNASRSCSGEYFPSIDLDNNQFTTPVCDLSVLCSHSATGESRRKKRQTDSDNSGFTGSASFLVATATNEVINDPPIIITNTTYSTNEDIGTISFTIAAGDPNNDEFAFLLDNSSEPTGNAILHPNGQATYKPCKDCFGKDEVPFIVREVRTDDLEALETSGIISINLIEVNDNPVLLSVQQGAAFIGPVTIIMDDYQEFKADNKLKIVLASYDVDLDSMSLTIHGNNDGTLKLHSQPVASNVTFQDCNTNWTLRQEQWDSVTESILNQNEFTLPLPCGMEDVHGDTVNWAATVLEYIPNKGFLGLETVQVVAFDEHYLVSEMLDISIYVLANPCENGASCVGPSWDTECTDTARMNGFENYTCDCLAGFTGSVCEVDINECLSSPCPANYSCIDQINAYQCICREDWPCSDTGLAGWEIGLLSTGLILLVALVIGIAFGVYKWYFKSSSGDEKDAPFGEERQLDNSMYSGGKVDAPIRKPQHHSSKEKRHITGKAKRYVYHGETATTPVENPEHDLLDDITNPVNRWDFEESDHSEQGSDCEKHPEICLDTRQKKAHKVFRIRRSRSVRDSETNLDVQFSA